MDVDAMSFLPSFMNLNVKGFNQARVNGETNYDFWVCRHAKQCKYNRKISCTSVLSSLLPELQKYAYALGLESVKRTPAFTYYNKISS